MTIHSQSSETYLLTGFPAKKLQDWLRLVMVLAVYVGMVTVRGCWTKWRDADE